MSQDALLREEYQAHEIQYAIILPHYKFGSSEYESLWYLVTARNTRTGVWLRCVEIDILESTRMLWLTWLVFEISPYHHLAPLPLHTKYVP